MRGSPPGVLRWGPVRTPAGTLYAALSPRGLLRLSWGWRDAGAFARHLEARYPGRRLAREGGALTQVERELREYFAGTRTRFHLPLDLEPLTPFQRRVLEATRRIPYGGVITYRELARRIGTPRASRAVGAALARNPVPIVVPCHRVVRGDGSLGGFTGGTGWKGRLLAMEGAPLPPGPRPP